MIEDLFPVALYHEQLTLDTDAIANYCLDLKKNTPGVEASNVGGWQSPLLTGTPEPLKDLFTAIDTHAEKYQEVLQYKHPLKIDGLWININRDKDYNVEHTHPNVVMAGVFHIKTPPLDKNDGALKFTHPLGQILEYDWPYDSLKETNRYNTTKWFVNPIVNQLLLFPGWINHMVVPHKNKDEERISISFNLNPKLLCFLP